jgi:hypothetical protein
MNQILNQSILYAEKHNFSVIPISKKKIPCVKWEKYQKEKADRIQLIEWLTNFPDANIAIVTGKISNLIVIDTDDAEATKVIDEILGESYEGCVAKTPRGGLHYYFTYPEGIAIPTKTELFKKCDIRGEGGIITAPPSFNERGKYEFLLGLENLCPAPESIIKLIKDCTTPKKSSPVIQNIEMFTEGRRDNDLFHVSNALVKGGLPESEIAEVLKRIIVSWGEDPDTKWVNDKIASALKRQESKERNLAEEIKEWVLSSSGVFLSSDIVKSRQLSSKEDQKNLSKILSRLCDEKVIERHGTKNGCFRRPDRTLQEINWQNASDKTMDIILPLGVTDYCNINEGNVIVVAGCKDAGKSAFCLNTAILNRKTYKIKYYSSEMFEMELLRRLKKVQLHLQIPLEELKQIKFYDRRDNFADVIEDEEKTIHIIDFLDVTKEFYMVGEMIKNIFDKLKKSICLIALQKDYGKDIARGGNTSLDKARIYVTLEKGIAKIVSGKDWKKEEVNPAGLQLSYKLIQGCKFILTNEWQHKTGQ